MSHDDFAFEPIRGIPAVLPKGETLLWQGGPAWPAHAVHAYHVRKVAIYFAILLVWRIVVGVNEGHTMGAIGLSCLWIAGLGTFTSGVLALLAWLSARTTVYSITSERFVLRHGIAVPITMNVPYALLEGADLRVYRGGSGDICLKLRRDQRVGYLVTWPHLRPGRITRPQPSFRSLRQPQEAAAILAKAIAAYAAANAVAIEVGSQMAIAA